MYANKLTTSIAAAGFLFGAFTENAEARHDHINGNAIINNLIDGFIAGSRGNTGGGYYAPDEEYNNAPRYGAGRADGCYNQPIMRQKDNGRWVGAGTKTVCPGRGDDSGYEEAPRPRYREPQSCVVTRGGQQFIIQTRGPCPRY